MELVQLRDRANHIARSGPLFCFWRHVSFTQYKWFSGSVNSHSRFCEQVFSRIGRLYRFKFLHQFPHALVRRLRHNDLNLNVLIAARTTARAGHAFFAKPERAAAVGPRWNTHKGASVNCGHFDLRAQGCFAHCHGHAGMQVISTAFKERMRPHFHPQIEIAWGRAHRSRIAFPRHTQPRTAGQSRRNSYLDGFRAAHAPLAVAGGARCADFASAAATGTGNIEAHLARSLLNGARTVANGTSLRRSYGPGSVASLARVQPGDLEFLHGAANSVPEVDFDLVFEIAARLVLRLHGSAAAPAEELAE